MAYRLSALNLTSSDDINFGTGYWYTISTKLSLLEVEITGMNKSLSINYEVNVQFKIRTVLVLQFVANCSSLSPPPPSPLTGMYRAGVRTIVLRGHGQATGESGHLRLGHIEETLREKEKELVSETGL